ncbi:alpha/beta fold hydrolase [Rathayibacter sp. VKM Ac-2803]|uniref:alpha/beta fold hydrolase n=1 Tax=Rathayibacter sp. VKM Ac-2803 TaxID=2609256 RepID=UPI0013583DD3|nr:alpha/beta hydrolase [Rathayibacter sp. VKM Ac-2803]MWV48942.1 alpha/beta fold hydrolase [Rathayibacter sp. VKM Ac-2803]
MTDEGTGRLLAVNGVDLWVREFGSPDHPGVVLVPGASSPSDWWDVELCEAIAAGGYRVLRYDLRDTGQSTTRPPGEADYTGDDLVDDLAGVITEAGLSPAHVIGLSLGGGLAQQLAMARPELVRSLTLLSTSPGGPGSEGLPQMSPALAASFAVEESPVDWTDRDAVLRRTLAEEALFGGSIPVDEARVRRISDSAFDRSIDLSAGSNHWAIPSASGTREQLATITASTLVVHGTEDPLFPLGHGEALAREIPGAHLLPVPGLGHQFPPPETWPLLVPALLEHLGAADGAS